jgi:hypothetical protein
MRAVKISKKSCDPIREGMLPTLLFRPADASEMAKRWFKSQNSTGPSHKAPARLGSGGLSHLGALWHAAGRALRITSDYPGGTITDCGGG